MLSAAPVAVPPPWREKSADAYIVKPREKYAPTASSSSAAAAPPSSSARSSSRRAVEAHDTSQDKMASAIESWLVTPDSELDASM